MKYMERFDSSHPHMKTLTYTWHEDGESFTADLDDYDLIEAEHGPHGWAGMGAVKTALDKAAEISGWTVRHVGDPCI